MTRTHLIGAALIVVTIFASASAAADHRHERPWRGAGPAKVTFVADGIHKDEALALRAPVLVERAELLRDIRSLQRRIEKLRAASDEARPALRGALCHAISGLEQDVERLRVKVRHADRLRAHIERRKDPRHIEDAPAEELVEEEPALEPVAPGELASLMDTLRREPFAADRLAVLKSVVPRRHFTTAQVAQLTSLFAFARPRMEALVALYPQTVDPENFHQTYRLLPFAHDRRKLIERIGATPDLFAKHEPASR